MLPSGNCQTRQISLCFVKIKFTTQSLTNFVNFGFLFAILQLDLLAYEVECLV